MAVTVYKTIQTLEPELVDENDLVPVNEAARISGMPASSISRLIDRGTLPEYRFIPKIDDTVQRFTLRSFLMEYAKTNKSNKRGKKSKQK